MRSNHASLSLFVRPLCRAAVLFGNAGAALPLVTAERAEARGGGPTVTSQPALSTVVAQGETVTLTVEAAGTGTLTYQWRFDGAPILDGAHYTGTGTAMLQISSVTVFEAGRYTCLVSDDLGTVLTNFAFVAVQAPHWNLVPTNTLPPNGASPMAFDTLRDIGVVWTSNCTATPMEGTWELQGNNWLQLSPTGRPSTCARGYIAFDKFRNVAIQYGGSGGDDRAYEYDGAAWVRSAAPGPAPRFGHRMTGVVDRQAIFMFGGRRAADNVLLNEAYEYNGAAWTLIAAPGPAARQDFTMAYDPMQHRVVLFGGNGANSRLGDTWEYDVIAQTWAQINTPTAPSPRAAAAMVYFPPDNALYMFGGFDGAAFMNDTWRYDCAAHTWSQVAVRQAPTLGQGYMDYDDLASRALLMQGSEMWELVNYPATGCPADYNGNSDVNSQDLFDFINDFFGGTADFNGDGMSNSQDFFDFVSVFFSPC